ncbi:polyprenyl synthetase family protein [candidate division KSB1 bacterium]|nr:polyprenyl synthetase family protein [candidate division KSB1 bacterium]RQW07372.1 MAG: polyprenyl synthetase family protein [candidate division KSB1 bacterium]
MHSDFIKQTQKYRERLVARIFSYLSAEHPASLYEPMRYALQDGGKLLRPILAQIICEAVGGDQENVLNAAVALEFVHVFSLVHDDIMDKDDMRRGRATVHKKWDANAAILCGDAILIKAYEALGRTTAVHLSQTLAAFNRGILEVCEGQALDMEFEDRDDVSLDEYFYMIDRKTARLFSLACEIGALLGDGSAEQIQGMRRFGMQLGRAFQIQDDLLDLLADQTTLGKDVGSDIQKDKKTFLMIHSRQHATPEQLDQLLLFVHKNTLSPHEIQHVISILNEIGTIAAAQKQVQDALEKARQSLQLLPKSESHLLLSNLLDMLEHRTY